MYKGTLHVSLDDWLLLLFKKFGNKFGNQINHFKDDIGHHFDGEVTGWEDCNKMR